VTASRRAAAASSWIPSRDRRARGRGGQRAAAAAASFVAAARHRKDPRYLTNQATTGSELIIPILLGDNVVGTLDIEEAHADAFTPDDEKLFEAIARELRPLYRNVVVLGQPDACSAA
jgi:putative methionine-R-sulfoxide reductase with GAF domain